MDSKACKLIDMVLKHEGGYAMVKNDMGGETYRGITRKNFPSWSGWKIVDSKKPLKNNTIIKDVKLEENVREFYYQNFYLPLKINKIQSLLISGHLLCHGVNAGIKNVVKLLQKSINIVYKVSIAVDGVIGDITLKYTNSDKVEQLAQTFIEQRNQYYRNLVKNKPSQKKFLNGWLKRVKNTTQECSSNVFFSLNIQKNDIIHKILYFIYNIIKILISKK